MLSHEKMVIITLPFQPGAPGGPGAEGSVLQALPGFPWEEQASEDTARPWPVRQRPSHGLYLHLAGKEALQVLTATHTGGPSCFCVTLVCRGSGVSRPCVDRAAAGGSRPAAPRFPDRLLSGTVLPWNGPEGPLPRAPCFSALLRLNFCPWSEESVGPRGCSQPGPGHS